MTIAKEYEWCIFLGFLVVGISLYLELLEIVYVHQYRDSCQIEMRENEESLQLIKNVSMMDFSILLRRCSIFQSGTTSTVMGGAV